MHLRLILPGIDHARDRNTDACSLKATHEAHLTVTRRCSEAVFFPLDDAVAATLRCSLKAARAWVASACRNEARAVGRPMCGS